MLTDKECKAAAAGDKPRKLFDGHGLHLFITPKGAKVWRLKYRFAGKEKQLAFGPFPAVSLREARDMTQDALRLLRDGNDPGLEKKRAKGRAAAGGDSFREAARAWHALMKPGWKPKHAQDIMNSLETEVFPAIGSMSMTKILPADVRTLVEAIQSRGAVETAHRIRARISAVFVFAMASGLAETDPAASIKAVLRPVKHKMRPALLQIADCRTFIRQIESQPEHPGTKLASRLLALTATRPGTVRWAEPGEFEDLDGPEPIWRIPAAKMKLSRIESEQDMCDFIVPLAPQTVEVVLAALQLSGKRRYLFPSHWYSHRPISENALIDAYLRIPGNRGRHVPHGWRASFSTIMNERATELGRIDDRAVIDLMLAHQVGGVEGRYNRAAFMPRRRELACEWAGLLLEGALPAAMLLEGKRR